MSSITFKVSVEESHAVLKKVLPLMSQHRVPTIPQNYAIWYDYVCEANESLVAELKARMDRGLGFTPDVCASLFDKYFIHTLRAQVEEIQDSMRHTVDTAVSEIGGFHAALDGFAGVLDCAGDTLGRTSTEADLCAVVSTLRRETRATRERAAAVETLLQAMAAELGDMRVRVNALSRDSLQDALTGVANRRAFDDGVRRLTREAGSSDAELCLLLVDVDEFARFNEAHGSEVGDQVLRFLAQEMDQCVKGRDLLARYAGEEFAVLLPDTAYNGALMLAESIRAIIEAQVIETESGQEIEDLTISVGVAQFRVDEESGDFVARAQACLEQSRSQGRNRVTGERDLRF